MNLSAWMWIDLSLALLTVSLAWLAVTSEDLRRAVIMFMALGLALALVWARLYAPDLALAEAAIGSGLTGVLLLQALRDHTTHADNAADAGSHKHTAPRRPVKTFVITLLVALVGLALVWAVYPALTRESAPSPLAAAELVQQNLDQSGVSNPVTAVLLNFRAYDTLLELAVLLAAVLGILALGQQRRQQSSAPEMLVSLLRWLVPVLVISAGYLLWIGASAPGGAFQAGALLAGVFALLYLSGNLHVLTMQQRTWRFLLVVGVGSFLIVGIGVSALQLPILSYPNAWAGSLILLIEAAATLSVAATLSLAMLGGQPTAWSAPPVAESAKGVLHKEEA